MMTPEVAVTLVRAFKAGGQAIVEIIEEKIQEGLSPLAAIAYAKEAIIDAEIDAMVVVVGEAISPPPQGSV